MRTLNLIKGDLRFIQKYGIMMVYVIFTAVYLIALTVIKGTAKEITAEILVYTDPAAMGLFFMGAFIMLEKSQRVNCALAISPVKLDEYILSKAVSLLVPGTIVGVILCAYAAPHNLLPATFSIVLSSVMFSLCGLIAAVNTDTLNGFMIAVIPFEILIIAPALFYKFEVLVSDLWIIHPGVSALRLISGNCKMWPLAILSIIFWTAVIYYFCRKSVSKYFTKLGGGKIL